MRKKAVWILVSVVLTAIVVSLGIVYAQTAFTVNDMLDYRSPERPDDSGFSLSGEDVNFSSKDGLNIYGQLFMPSDPKGIVILVPGWDMTHTSMYGHAAWLYENGYASLDLDLRTRGRSEGEVKGAGYTEVIDVESAVGYIKTRPEIKDLPMALIGHSLGANTVIKVLHPDIRAIIAISGYTDFVDMVRESVEGQPLLETLVPFCARIHVGFKYGFGSIKSAVDEGLRQDAALMVVHGKIDTQVPFSHGERFSQAFSDKEGFVFLPVNDSVDHAPWLNSDSTVNTEVVDGMKSFLDGNLLR